MRYRVFVMAKYVTFLNPKRLRGTQEVRSQSAGHDVNLWLFVQEARGVAGFIIMHALLIHTEPRPAFRLPGYRPSDMDKKMLIWSGRFKSADQIPETVS